jgi:hypothetical protein
VRLLTETKSGWTHCDAVVEAVEVEEGMDETSLEVSD